MKNEFYTNKANYQIHKEKILQDFDLIKLEILSKKNSKEYAKLWFFLKEQIEVLAYYTYNNFIFLLTKKEQINKIDREKLYKNL